MLDVSQYLECMLLHLPRRAGGPMKEDGGGGGGGGKGKKILLKVLFEKKMIGPKFKN